jgi:hypothetical protein
MPPFCMVVNGLSSGSRDSSYSGTACGMTSGQSSGALGVSSDSSGARSGALASRAVRGAPSDHRSRRVRISDVWRYSSLTTVRSGIHGETAIAGTRTPGPVEGEPVLTRGTGRVGGRCRRWGDMVVGAAVLVEVDHEQRVVDV